MGITNIGVLTRPDTDTNTDIKTEQDLPDKAHYIDRNDDERPAEVIVLEARVNGTLLTAMCGAKFIPSQDPKKLPICETCVEMMNFAKDIYGFK